MWKSDDLATAEPICSKPSDYAAAPAKYKAEKQADYEREVAFFKPGVKKYFYNEGAGHYRLDVSEDSVDMAFYPGDALVPARTFALK